jgi:hypothetical protein
MTVQKASFLDGDLYCQVKKDTVLVSGQAVLYIEASIYI